MQQRIGAKKDALAQALNRAGARLDKSIPQLNVSVLSVPEPAADRVAAALSGTGLFTFIERDSIARGGQSAVDPNDPNFLYQWHLTQIQGPAAWVRTTGTPSIIIAMIDSGVDSTHPDLAAKMVPGWNFLTGTSNTADDEGHGSATAGTAAAATNNALGVSSVAWNNMIMPLEILNSSNSATYSDLANAITYAADHGARVINISLGGSSASSTLQSAVNYAWNKGVVIFASAMNNSSSTPVYPAACDNVVAVSATDTGDVFASFSNYGSWVDISAPGTNILTTMNGGGYGSWSGTSFSSPIVAATAALVLSVRPSLSAAALVSLLEQNSDDLGSPGWDPYFGYGRVNAYKAVLAAGSAVTDTVPPSVSITSPSGGTVFGTIAVTGTASDNLGVARIELWVDGQLNATAASAASPFSINWSTTTASNAVHSLTIKAYDATGNVGSSAAVNVTVYNAVAAPDTQAPTVTIDKPGNGATVSGNVAVSASATDNLGVSQVAIYIDGTLKSTAVGSKVSYTWNTRKATLGTHTITASAWDGAGNAASTSISVRK